MAITVTFYNKFKTKLLSLANSVDFDTDTIKIALCTATYTPDYDAHDFFDDITNEVTGTGYTAGGATLTTPTVTQDNTDDEGVFDADDVTWASSTITAAKAVLYKDTGVAGTSPLIALVDFGGNKVSDNGSFTISWNAEGVINVN